MPRPTKYVEVKLCNSYRIKTDATVDEIRKVEDFYEK